MSETGGSSGIRQAALALHALSARDQQLILAQLPGYEQDSLRECLAELTLLGFETTPPYQVGDGVPAPESPQARLAAAVAAAGALLAAEPASLVAQVLHAGDWEWADDFLRHLPAARRTLVLAALASLANQNEPAPARVRFLQAAVNARLKRPAALLAEAPAAPRSPLAAWLTKARAWMR